LTRREIKELLRQPGCKPVQDNLKYFMGQAYQLADGRFFIVCDPIGSLFPSRAAFEKLMAQIEAEGREQSPQRLWQEMFPQGKEFVAKVPELIDQLAEILGLSRGDLDYGAESLDKVDERVRQRYQRKDRLKGGIFAPLVAYLGEVIRRTVGGEWRMDLDRAVGWVPKVVVRGDWREYCPPHDVYEELYEIPEAEGSLRRRVPRRDPRGTSNE
jgi:hypothetical protein